MLKAITNLYSFDIKVVLIMRRFRLCYIAFQRSPALPHTWHSSRDGKRRGSPRQSLQGSAREILRLIPKRSSDIRQKHTKSDPRAALLFCVIGVFSFKMWKFIGVFALPSSLFGWKFGSWKFGSFMRKIIIAKMMAFANTRMDLFAERLRFRLRKYNVLDKFLFFFKRMSILQRCHSRMF